MHDEPQIDGSDGRPLAFRRLNRTDFHDCRRVVRFADEILDAVPGVGLGQCRPLSSRVESISEHGRRQLDHRAVGHFDAPLGKLVKYGAIGRSTVGGQSEDSKVERQQVHGMFQ